MGGVYTLTICTQQLGYPKSLGYTEEADLGFYHWREQPPITPLRDTSYCIPNKNCALRYVKRRGRQPSMAPCIHKLCPINSLLTLVQAKQGSTPRLPLGYTSRLNHNLLNQCAIFNALHDINDCNISLFTLQLCNVIVSLIISCSCNDLKFETQIGQSHFKNTCVLFL